MGSAATTRAARTADGKCAVCLARPASAKHPTCATCRKAIATYGLTRYKARRKAKVCVQCGEPSEGAYLCETHAERRRKRRAS